MCSALLDCNCSVAAEVYSAMMTGFAQVLVSIVTIIGFLYGLREYFRNRKDTVRDKLAREAYAFYFIEQEAVKEIKQLKLQLGKTESEKTVRNDLRKKAIDVQTDKILERPKMNPNKYKQYINN